MAERFDLIVAGDGPGVHAAAYFAAKAGLRTAWLPAQNAPKLVDPWGLLYAAAAEQVSKSFATDASGLSKVVSHRVFLLGDGSGTSIDFRADQRKNKPEAFVFERQTFNTWLAQAGAEAGVKRLGAGRVAEMLRDEAGQLQAIRTSEGLLVRARAIILGAGAEHPIRDELAAALEPEPKQQVVAVARVAVGAEKLQERCGLEAGEGMFGRIVGSIGGGVPAAGWCAGAGDGIQLGLSMVVGPHFQDPSGVASGMLQAIVGSAALRPLLRGQASINPAVQIAPVPGYRHLAPLYGNGWMLLGPSTRMGDPLRHETVHIELTCAAHAVEAAKRAIAAEDTSSRPLSVYRGMLDDSYVLKDLKARKDSVEELERDPSVMSFYPQFVNRMLAHDTTSGLTPRRERNREFFKNLRNERPVWEFAMGFRKGLRLMRD